MTQLPFPSTIEAQPRNITFLTIKTMVRKIQKNDGQTGSCAWTRQCLDKGRGGTHKTMGSHFAPIRPSLWYLLSPENAVYAVFTHWCHVGIVSNLKTPWHPL